ncbi:ligase-associated DNA damage response exonuclease [Salinimonas chungwhensis]|uniref:ligase-associated DNA damage response exonuclease n=1 Tax=Salinimonas chungwhensis TaxID=265425 RepID=UPI00039B3496|nr:ligase-associated DNA damage response exonuclease [Salinimonas chungwhensis]
MHPQEWVSVEEAGLYCRPADIYIDPMLPVNTAIVTHGHADHARSGHNTVYATPQTLAIMTTRYGEEMAITTHELAYRQSVQLGSADDPVIMTLYPAGHIMGSSQVLFEYRGSRLVVSGDYKRRPDPTCPPFEVVPCDVFITEATFGLPVFTHPPIAAEIDKLITSLKVFPHRCHLVGAYALGKCQRVILALRQAGYTKPVYLHGALIRLCNLYQEHGVDLGELIAVNDVEDRSSLAGEVVIAPPSALVDRWSRAFPDVRTVMASGWMQIRARARQKQVELPLIISDHCDWPELIQTISEVQPNEVWVTHGREDALVHQATKMGFKAKALSLLGYEDDEETG